MTEVANLMPVPPLGGRAISPANYEEKVIPRHQISTLEPGKRAAILSLLLADIARKVCVTVGKDQIGRKEGEQQISRILRGRFAPGATDAIFQEVAKFTNLKRTDHTTDVYLLAFDVLREKAEARMVMGSGSPDEFVSILCMQNAALSENEASLALAGMRNTLASPEVVRRMRRLFGPCGMAVRQDVLMAADLDAALEEKDYAAKVA